MKPVIVLAIFIGCAAAFSISQGQSPAVPNTIRWPFTICGETGWHASTLFMSDIPAKGMSLDILAMGKTVQQQVNYDYAKFEVRLNGAAIDNYTLMISKNCTMGQVVDIVDTFKLPEEAPSGTYVHTYTMMNTDDQAVGCITYTFKL